MFLKIKYIFPYQFFLKRHLFFAVFILSMFVIFASCSNQKVEGYREPQAMQLPIDVKKLSPQSLKELEILSMNFTKYMLHAANRSDPREKFSIYLQGKDYLSAMLPAFFENAQNPNYQVSAGDTPLIHNAPQWTLADEIEYLNDQTKSVSKKFPIDLFLAFKMMAAFGDQTLSALSQEQKMQLISTSQNANVDKVLGSSPRFSFTIEELKDLEALSKQESEEQFALDTVTIFERKFQPYFQKLMDVGKAFRSIGGIDANNSMVQMVIEFIDYYYDHLHPDILKTILAELMMLGNDADEKEVLGVILKNTGPALGKLLQQVGKEEAMGDRLEKVIEILESSGKAVPEHLTQRLVDSDTGGYEFVEIDRKALGTGTVAQVNKAKMKFQGKVIEVALRYLKPGVVERAQSDIAILRRFQSERADTLKQFGDGISKVFERALKSVEGFLASDLNIPLSIEKQSMAYEIFSKKVEVIYDGKPYVVNFKIPKVYLPKQGTKTNLHVQELLVGGAKFSKLDSASLKALSAELIAGQWFEEALFRSGYFNGDLHQGNFRIVLVEGAQEIHLVFYDQGMVEKLRPEEQRAFILLGVGSKVKSPGIVAGALYLALEDKTTISKNELLKMVQEEVSKSTAFPSEEEWLKWTIKKGVMLFPQIGLLGRGSLLVKQIVTESNVPGLFKKIILKSGGLSLWKAIVDKDTSFPLRAKDVPVMLGIKLKESCLQLLTRLNWKKPRSP